MRRIVVAGGLGFFGSATVECLRRKGAHPVRASRGPGAEVRLDVEDPDSIRAALRPGDVVVDAAGPFQGRTGVLAEAAIEIGFDLLDLSDSLAHAQRILDLRARIDASEIRVLPSCSAISVISAAAVRWSGARVPARVDAFLAPATRHTATRGTGGALLASVGRPIRVWREGRLLGARGWGESRFFALPPPIGPSRGWLFESADSIFLPRVWPSLRSVGLWVDTRVPGLNRFLSLVARRPTLRPLVEKMRGLGLAFSRRLGAQSSVLAFEIEEPGRSTKRAVLVAPRRGYFASVVPAVLAALALARNRFEPSGLVLPDRQVEPEAWMRELDSLGIRLLRSDEPCDRERVGPEGFEPSTHGL